MPTADLNKMLVSVRAKTDDLKKSIKELLIDYENLYKEAHHKFSEERIASGGIDGLEEFYYLTQILRRNRDVAASLMRATQNIRDTEKYKFVEEEAEMEVKEKEAAEAEAKKKKKQKRPPAGYIEINQEALSDIKIPEEVSPVPEEEVAHAQ